MKLKEKNPPREFETGFQYKRTIKDCGSVEMKENEQLTFVTESGAEYDVTRKDFGFYATPSLNGRLKRFNLRAVLVRNRLDQFFILLVERGKEDLFHKYIQEEELRVVHWMDDTDKLMAIDNTSGVASLAK